MKQRFVVLSGILLCLVLNACTAANSAADPAGGPAVLPPDAEESTSIPPLAEEEGGSTAPSAEQDAGIPPLAEEEGGSTAPSAEQDEGAAPSAEKEEKEAMPAAVVPDMSMAAYALPESEALSFVQDMRIGWNLGNTLDAVGDTVQIAEELSLESAWVGIQTTKEMMEALKNAGFQTIRIPVSWHNHLLDDDFTISPVWMARVREIVDYVIENDLYAILNIHHDVGEAYYYPDQAHFENSAKYIRAIWGQIAEEFGDYDHKLIFEGINEPRLTGTTYEWYLDMKQPICQEAVECVNQLNQIFVDTVRGSGEKNQKRYLMVPGYDASAEYALLEAFRMPEDLPENDKRILVSVHAYTPYNFALQAQTEKGSTAVFKAEYQQHTREIDQFMDRLYQKYIVHGVGVVIGEFGARNKENYQDRTEYAFYFTAAAKARGMTACWWDNHAFTGSGELFGLFRRRVLQFAFPEILNGLMKGLESVQ